MEGLKLKYFVLNPNSSDYPFRDASRHAMRAFAEHIQENELKLANDLRDWIDHLEFLERLADTREGQRQDEC